MSQPPVQIPPVSPLGEPAPLHIRLRDRLGDCTLDFDVTLPGRGVIGLYGPSGSGKTSLLRFIAGLHPHTKATSRNKSGLFQIKPGPEEVKPGQGPAISGPGAVKSGQNVGYSNICRIGDEIWQDDTRCLPAHRRAVGYVFQEQSLFAHLTVRQNLVFAADKPGSTFEQTIDLLGLTHLLPRMPHTLSGGERQRVAIGRALLSAPKILLMDEPLSALDSAAKQEILPYIEQICRSFAIPLLYVSHQLDEIEHIATTLLLIEKGRIRALGPLSSIQTDPNLPLFSAPSAAVCLDAQCSAYDAEYGLATLAVPGGTFQAIMPKPTAPRAIRVKIFARDVSLSLSMNSGTSILNLLPARIIYAKPVDMFHVTIALRLGNDETGATILSRMTRKSWEMLQLGLGSAVFAQIKAVSFESTGDASLR